MSELEASAPRTAKSINVIARSVKKVAAAADAPKTDPL